MLNAEQANACLDAGAAFVVSPGLDLETVRAVRARGAAMLPGAFTPSEVMAAAKAGAEIIKLFPCSAAGGASYLRSLRGPLPHVKLMPTGGVSLENIAALGRLGPNFISVGRLTHSAPRRAQVTRRASPVGPHEVRMTALV